MPETAAGPPADSDSTDLTTMDPGGGVGLALLEDVQQRLRGGTARGLVPGVRLIFRAALAPQADAAGEPAVAVDGPDSAPLGSLPPADARRYRAVTAELRRTGRRGVCAGYLRLADGGALEARLLLDEPYECLRRIETDVLERVSSRERTA